MPYLVAGATGKSGRHVVDHLLRAGQRVRALTRDPARAALPREVEVVRGDPTDPDSLLPALDGITGLHLPTSGGSDYGTLTTGPEIAALAEKAGVRRATLLWNGIAGPVEETFESSRIESTRLEPGTFMGNTLGWAESIRTTGTIEAAHVDAPDAVVDESDIGAVAATILVHGGHDGGRYNLTGPEALSLRRRVQILATVLGKEVRLAELSDEQARAQWRAAGYDDDLIEQLISWQGDPRAYTVVPTIQQILGRPARTFAEWAADHTDAFAG